ncbi:nuclease [Cyanobium sp. FGCU-52]|nr:nuclease [Cyanobium sp. FGCU52]
MPPLPSPRWRSGCRLWRALVVVAASLVLLLVPAGADAAQVLQVRGPTLLQIGDGNRSVPVELACVAVAPANGADAVAWLRRELPRQTRVQLRPVRQHDGRLVAQVRRLDSDGDLGGALVAAGLAHTLPGCP